MLRPVPLNEQIAQSGKKSYFEAACPDGSDTFGRWIHGGCSVSSNYFTIQALDVAGLHDRADMLLNAMLERQARGIFPNGGGFQNGIVDQMPFGAEFFEWDGKPSGYEGHLVYSWAFLHAMLMRQPAIRQRILRPLHI
jgi:hypothetical protein